MANMIETGYAAAAGLSGTQSTAVNGREKADSSFSDAMLEKYTLSPKDMSLTEYKLYIRDKIRKLYTHPSQRRVDWLIDITDAAYRRMQTDPLYEQQVLDYLARRPTHTAMRRDSCSST